MLIILLSCFLLNILYIAFDVFIKKRKVVVAEALRAINLSLCVSIILFIFSMILLKIFLYWYLDVYSAAFPVHIGAWYELFNVNVLSDLKNIFSQNNMLVELHSVIMLMTLGFRCFYVSMTCFILGINYLYFGLKRNVIYEGSIVYYRRTYSLDRITEYKWKDAVDRTNRVRFCVLNLKVENTKAQKQIWNLNQRILSYKFKIYDKDKITDLLKTYSHTNCITS